jgi:hypothetical protein
VGRLLNRTGPLRAGVDRPDRGRHQQAGYRSSRDRGVLHDPAPVRDGHPDPDWADRERLQAEAAAYWDQATKGKTWLAGEGVQFGQFPEATLDGFVRASTC